MWLRTFSFCHAISSCDLSCEGKRLSAHRIAQVHHSRWRRDRCKGTGDEAADARLLRRVHQWNLIQQGLCIDAGDDDIKAPEKADQVILRTLQVRSHDPDALLPEVFILVAVERCLSGHSSNILGTDATD